MSSLTKEEFEKSGAVNIEPLHDPLVSHLTGQEHLRDKLKKKGIDIDAGCGQLRSRWITASPKPLMPGYPAD